MLKWLRKYNTYILVVGGCLLMVAFLLQGTLEELGRRGMLGGTVFRVGDRKVGAEEYTLAHKEHEALRRLVGAQLLPAIGGGVSTEHWILLTQEAQKAGLVGGAGDGREFIPVLSKDIVQSILLSSDQGRMAAQFMPQQFETAVATQSAQMQQQWATFADAPPSDFGMGSDQVLKAFAKLRGVLRMQMAYRHLPRFSDRRLAAGARALTDSADVSYVLVPADRAAAGVAEPTEQEVRDAFARFKDTPKGGGDYGVGYTLPPRVKLAWLMIDRAAVEQAITPDADPQMLVAARRRFLQLYPTGTPPEGKSADDENKRLLAEVKRERVDAIMKAAEQAARGEIDRATRKLDAEAGYKRLPDSWAGVDFAQLRESVAAAVQRSENVTIPAPRVTTRTSAWMDQAEVRALPGIGTSSIKRGTLELAFADLLFGRQLENGHPVGGVRELVGNNDLGLQTRVPAADPTHDTVGNAYFYLVTDARKQSPPDTLEEIKDEVARDIKRMRAYEQLKQQVSSLRETAVSQGLDAVAKAPEGVPGAAALPVRQASVSRSGTRGQDAALDVKPFRDDVMARADALDPTTDPAKWPADQTTGALAVDKALGVAVYQIKKLAPLTVERYRQRQNSLQVQLIQDELKTGDQGPFSLEALEKRLGVKYEDGRKTAAERDDASKG